LNIVMIADIVGRPGRRIISSVLDGLRADYGADVVVANGENAAGGLGLTGAVGRELLDQGIDILTMGNHTWDKKELIEFLESEERIVRPANYPPGVPGRGSTVFSCNGGSLAVINLLGRVFLHDGDCPFRTAQIELEKLAGRHRGPILVDMHAEATSEKMALAYFLDGRVSAVVGTHTHVATDDLRILPGGTAYVTDIGMTGPVDSVIGIKKDLIIRRFMTQMPVRFEVPDGQARLEGVFIRTDEDGKALQIEKISMTEDD
jgi:metallophosphoesterase (TIGR00282 family)